jgi:hypothetical protein
MGTEAHAGRRSKTEKLAAMQFANRGLVKNGTRFMHPEFKRSVFGQRMNVAHHASGGRTRRLRKQAAMNAVERFLVKCDTDDQPKCDYLVRAHIHHYVSVLDGPYTVRYLGLPCWQLPTTHVHKIAPDDLPDIGAVFIEVYADGRSVVVPRLYRYRPSDEKYPKVEL